MKEPSEEQELAALKAARRGMKKAYERRRKMAVLPWRERALWVILSGLAAAGACLLSGCGHSVKLGPEGAVICKDGTCLFVSAGGFTFTQAVPETALPVMQRKNK